MQGRILGLLAETHVHAGAGQSEQAIDLPVARERTTDYPFVPGSGVKGALRDACERPLRARMRETQQALRNGTLTGRLAKELAEFLDIALKDLNSQRLRQMAREHLDAATLADGDATAERLREFAAELLELDRVFGAPDGAGDLLISDARLLLLPVRCLAHAYLWLTCPYLVERFRRDRERALGGSAPVPEMPDFPGRSDPPVVYCRGAENETLFLEERLFRRVGDLPQGLVDLVAPLVGDAGARSRLAGQMALVSNEEFGWFARFALPVHAHNVLDGDKKEGEPRTKTSTNLWYEESLAPDTLLYVVTLFRSDATRRHLDGLFGTRPYLQVGGNETTGQGWFRIALPDGGRP